MLLHLVQGQVVEPIASQVVLHCNMNQWVVDLVLPRRWQQLVGEDATCIDLAHKCLQLVLEQQGGVVDLLLAEAQLTCYYS